MSNFVDFFFFLVGQVIKDLFHKKDIMFMIVNTQTLKQIQVPQEEIRIERGNSEMEIQLVKPQILAHVNKVPTSIGFKRSMDLTVSSKVRLLRSRQINHSYQLAPYSKYQINASPANSTSQKEGKLLSSASPIGFQISKNIHSTKHRQTYNGVEDDSQFPNHTSTYNTN